MRCESIFKSFYSGVKKVCLLADWGSPFQGGLIVHLSVQEMKLWCSNDILQCDWIPVPRGIA